MKLISQNLFRFVGLGAFLAVCSCQSLNEKPEAPRPEIVSRADWNANPPVSEMIPHQPTFITIHHTATMQKPAMSLEDKLRNLQKFSQNEGTLAGGRKKPAWPDVPYHFYIPSDGRIGEARNVNFAGDTNTEYNPAGHLLVTLEGNFEEEQPGEEQMRSTRLLVNWLAQTYRIPPEKIGTHKDYAKTACPGKNLQERLGELRQAVSSLND